MFDYIVVGSGSAGCVLASRLVAAGQRVALVEAGASDAAFHVRVPAAFTKLFKTSRDWDFATTPQGALAERPLYWPRGKVLGGCSSTNAQMWVPGFAEDYDGWRDSGAMGWDFASVRPYFERAELTQQAAVSDTGMALSALRSPNAISAAFLGACHQLGYPPSDGVFPSRPEGCTPVRVTQRDGKRWSSVDGYLRPLLGDPRLRVLLNTRAERVVFKGRRAVGVDVVDARGVRATLRAEREVVLAAGAIGSPHLLMLSGVGDPRELAAHGVPVRAPLVGVGRNLQDHLMSVVVASCPAPVTLVNAESPRHLLQYLFRKRGPLTSNVAEAYAYVRTRPTLRLPDVELLFAPAPFIRHGLEPTKRHGISIGAVLLTPESRGRIQLRSRDPRVAPRIDPGYLADAGQADLGALVAGVRKARELFQTSALRPYVDGFLQAPASDSKEALEQFVRRHSETVYHPVGTCRMGEDDSSVVDASLRVHGLDGLRVVDASVMPRIIRGHTHAPSVMIGERGASLLLREQRALPPRPPQPAPQRLPDSACTRVHTT